MKKNLLLLMVLVLVGAKCKDGVKEDTQMSALEAGDYTALIEGCGNQPVPGYTYCRKIEGNATGELLFFLAPPSIVCPENICAEIKVYNPSGEVAWGGIIPKGQPSISVEWKQLTKKDTFDVGDRGFWGYMYTYYYVGEDGNTHQTVTQGEIRLRVIRKAYISLQEVSEDSNFVWKWKHKGHDIKMTTGGRTYVSN